MVLAHTARRRPSSSILQMFDAWPREGTLLETRSAKTFSTRSQLKNQSGLCREWNTPAKFMVSIPKEAQIHQGNPKPQKPKAHKPKSQATQGFSHPAISPHFRSGLHLKAGSEGLPVKTAMTKNHDCSKLTIARRPSNPQMQSNSGCLAETPTPAKCWDYE